MDFNVNGVTIEEVKKEDNALAARLSAYATALAKKEKTEGETKDV